MRHRARHRPAGGDPSGLCREGACRPSRTGAPTGTTRTDTGLTSAAASSVGRDSGGRRYGPGGSRVRRPPHRSVRFPDEDPPLRESAYSDESRSPESVCGGRSDPLELLDSGEERDPLHADGARDGPVHLHAPGHDCGRGCRERKPVPPAGGPGDGDDPLPGDDQERDRGGSVREPPPSPFPAVSSLLSGFDAPGDRRRDPGRRVGGRN